MNAEVHFFHTGNGDTILIRGGDEWGLIDANFVPGVSARVEAKLNGVKKLRFLCITHFDLDHIRGLADFLERNFVEDDGNEGQIWHIEQIILPTIPTTLDVLRYLLKDAEKRGEEAPLLKDDVSGEAQKLLRVLCKIGTAKPMKKGQLMPEFLMFQPGGKLERTTLSEVAPSMGPWDCFSIGPQWKIQDRYSRQLEDYYKGENFTRKVFPKVENNAVSRVFALRHNETNNTVLLTGDSTKLRKRHAGHRCARVALHRR